MRQLSQDQIVPASEASVQLRLSRERLIRRIQTGEIAGGRTDAGQWYVERSALPSGDEQAAAGV
jgi:hypothetical protein